MPRRGKLKSDRPRSPCPHANDRANAVGPASGHLRVTTPLSAQRTAERGPGCEKGGRQRAACMPSARAPRRHERRVANRRTTSRRRGLRRAARRRVLHAPRPQARTQMMHALPLSRRTLPWATGADNVRGEQAGRRANAARTRLACEHGPGGDGDRARPWQGGVAPRRRGWSPRGVLRSLPRSTGRGQADLNPSCRAAACWDPSSFRRRPRR